MEIHYSNRRRLPPESEAGAIFHPTLKGLFGGVDMISLNCPATPETINLINADSIGWMKPGVVFVNTARGSLVDETALIEALNSGHVAAAGLDVFSRTVETPRSPNVLTYLCCRTSVRRHTRLARQWVIVLWITLMLISRA